MSTAPSRSGSAVGSPSTIRMFGWCARAARRRASVSCAPCPSPATSSSGACDPAEPAPASAGPRHRTPRCRCRRSRSRRSSGRGASRSSPCRLRTEAGRTDQARLRSALPGCRAVLQPTGVGTRVDDGRPATTSRSSSCCARRTWVPRATNARSPPAAASRRCARSLALARLSCPRLRRYRWAAGNAAHATERAPVERPRREGTATERRRLGQYSWPRPRAR